MRCVLNYGPGEENLVAQVKSASGEADPIAYNGSLEQLMALLRNAACMSVVTRTAASGRRARNACRRHICPTDPARNGPYRVSGNLTTPLHGYLLRSHML